MTHARNVLKLAGAKLIARGSERAVYTHPDDRGLLIKVPKRKRDRLYIRLRLRYGPFHEIMREIEEYAALHCSSPEDTDLIERVVGFAETDIGLGLVVEALRDRNGNLAPTLRTMIGKGAYTETARKDVEAFLARILASDVVLHDLKTKNLVYAFDASRGVEHFVVVDGIGRRPDIGLEGLGSWINYFSKQRRIWRLRREIKWRLSLNT